MSMMMMHHVSGDNKPNTFIGGIGGVLVNNASDLASLLGISESNILLFNIVGSEVQFLRRINYTIPSFAFENDSNITYYKDLGNKITETGGGSFEGVSVMTEYISESTSIIGGSSFQLASIENFSFPNLLSMGVYAFSKSKVKTLNIPNYNGYLSGSAFRECDFLESIVGSNVTGILGYCFADSTTDFAMDFSSVIEIEDYAFYNSGKKSIVANNCTSIGVSSFQSSDIESIEMNSCLSLDLDCFRSSNLNSITANNLQTIGQWSLRDTDVVEFVFPELIEAEFGAFLLSTSATLIDIKKCKSIGTNCFALTKSGCVIKINNFLATSDSGNPDPELLNAKNNYSLIVEFYDDNGNYVSTL